MKKFWFFALCICLTAGLLSACTQPDVTTTGTATDTTTKMTTTAKTTTETTTETDSEAIDELVLPIVDTPLTVTCFGPISGDATAYGYYDNLADTPTAQYLFEKTGITIDYMHPPSGAEAEQFNLIVSSNEQPDFISGYMSLYKGGYETAIADGVIIDTEELVLNYAPNFRRRVLDNPDARKLAYNDNSVLIGFGAGYSLGYAYDGGYPYTGLFIRQDLLDKLALPMPVTVDDWFTVLRAFKEDGIQIPLAWGKSGWDTLTGSHAFASAFETAASGFFQKDGQVLYAKVQPGYKNYLQTLHQLFDEELLDPDFLTHTFIDHALPMMADGTAAAGAVHLYVWINTSPAAEANSFNFQPAPMPVATVGQTIKISDDYGFGGGGDGIGITTRSEHAKEIVMMYDYLYSEEGERLTNWGIEGESYEVGADGVPYLTQEMEDDLYRLNVVYCPNELNVMIDKVHDLIQYPLPVHKTAHQLWRTNVTAEWRMPPGLTMTPEENTTYTEIMTEIETYANEMIVNFILGEENLDNWDAYVQEIMDMGLQEAIDIRTATITRYNNR